MLYKDFVPANKIKRLWAWSCNLKFSVDFSMSWSGAQIGKGKGEQFTMQQVLSKGVYKYIEGIEWFHRGLFT